MGLEIALNVACLAYFFMFIARAGSSELVFDVTKYGAVAGGKTDNTKAFLDAWNSACQNSAGNASLLIPHGDFLVGPITFAGPCSNVGPTTVRIQGTLKAPPSIMSTPTVAWIEFRDLQGLRIGGGGTIDGQVTNAVLTKSPKGKFPPTSLRLIKVSNATVANLTLLNSKGFHVGIQRSAYVKVRHLNISAPADSQNTDGIHISGTNDVQVSNLTVSTGDDCISIGPGSTNVSITGVVCGPGHGISVGSLGKYKNEKDVVGVRVRNCTLWGTTNGVRIKTWPGSMPSQASNLTFEDIILHNVSNPIIIDQGYCPTKDCNVKPSLVKIRDVVFRKIRGTSRSPVAVNLMCSKSVPCQDVELEDINLEPAVAGRSNITSSCSNVIGAALGGIIPQLCI